jgi:hypothetical protein
MKTRRPQQEREVGRVWSEGAHYVYRCGGHELILSRRGVSDRLVAEIERAAVEFALVVDGPWLVLCYRIGDSPLWSAASPFNWHAMPERGRVLPAEVELAPETYTRLWSTLWISLVDAEDGEVRARRAVALRPEFTAALNKAIRDQALEQFSGAVGDHALAWLSHGEGAPIDRAVAWAKCDPVSIPEPSPPVDDEQLQREVQDQLRREPALDVSDIGVTVERGVVALQIDPHSGGGNAT